MEWLATRYDYVELDQWTIMPNHMHGIIVITGVVKGGSWGFVHEASSRWRRDYAVTSRATPHKRNRPYGKRKPIGRLVGAFETVSTKRINHLRDTPGVKIWQRNYYEHIIRNDDELNRIREYIANNPAQWETDRENPNVGVGAGFKQEFIGT